MSEDIPHPREVFSYEGQEAAETAFLSALERGRLHHAWLLVGPEGIGKATFAYRAARRLLGAAADPSLGPLGAAPDDPVSRQIMARAHPDLIVLQRDTEDGKARKGIPVDEARALPAFFAKSPAASPYRIAIIDAADDLNPSAANAVLKTLEEPPERGVLLLVSHAPGGLLPTLRSRCRRLRFDPPPVEASISWVGEKVGLDEEDARRLLTMAQGARGRAWRLAAAGALDADQAARDILGALPATDEAAMLTLAESFRGPMGGVRFNLILDRLADRIAAMASKAALAAQAGGGEGRALDRGADAWSMVVAMARDVETVNLDRADAFYTTLCRLRAIA
ncbi:MAG: DNA polymerase III subunit delta' [Caulobacteraceae bacterium]|nr:DNA polymerase III subunit delta' [Caulobacteraceae bacterium]